MKLSVETVYRLEGKEVGAFTVSVDKRDIQAILANAGVDAANKAIDGFVAKYVEQFKNKLSQSLNK